MFSPVFVTADLVLGSDGMGLRVINGFELIKYAIGIKFPTRRANLCMSFKQLRDAMYVKNRPLVFFPQCTRTNGRGVLDFPPKVQ